MPLAASWPRTEPARRHRLRSRGGVSCSSTRARPPSAARTSCLSSPARPPTAGVEVAASILTADFGNLYRVVRKLEGAGVDRFHLDVMDGHFVPNLTFGPDVVAAVRRLTRLPIDTHLMISEPARYVDRFIAAGSDTITFHLEVDDSDELKARR